MSVQNYTIPAIQVAQNIYRILSGMVNNYNKQKLRCKTRCSALAHSLQRRTNCKIQITTKGSNQILKGIDRLVNERSNPP